MTVNKAIDPIGDNMLAKESVLIPRATKKHDRRIWIYLYSEVVHIEKHRNPTRLNEFFAAMKGTGARVMAMHNYMQEFANIQFIRSGDIPESNTKAREAAKEYGFGGLYVMQPARENFTPIHELARNTDWTTFQPERGVPDFNLVKRVSVLVAAAMKAGATEEDITAAVHAASVDERKKIAEKKAEEEKKAKAMEAAAAKANDDTPSETMEKSPALNKG